jgi:F-type H+-transporting ATPase subunit epsilon
MSPRMPSSPTAPRWPHADGLHLVLSSLGEVVVDASGIASVRAEVASGGFGLWPGHADFLTVLGVGVLSWKDRDDHWHHCAVRRGVMTLSRGTELKVATREAIPGDNLDQLEREVIAQLAKRQQLEDESRRHARQLEVRALRELVRPRPGVGGPTGDWP